MVEVHGEGSMTKPRVTMRPIWLHAGSMICMILAWANTMMQPVPALYTYILIALGLMLTTIASFVAKKEREMRRRGYEEQLRKL